MVLKNKKNENITFINIFIVKYETILVNIIFLLKR